MKKMNKKGFTLMEMLIVIAIIAILIAIAIPTFTAALEKSRQKTDLANARALKSLVVAQYMAGEATDQVYKLISTGNEDETFYLHKNGQDLIAATTDGGTPESADAMLITAKWSGQTGTTTGQPIKCVFDSTCKMKSSAPKLPGES